MTAAWKQLYRGQIEEAHVKVRMLGLSYFTMTMNASQIYHYKDDFFVFFSVIKNDEGLGEVEDLCGWHVGCSPEPLWKFG